MKTLLRILLVALASVVTAFGQSADNLVLQGREFLAAKNMTNANARFMAAVVAAPNHQSANALYAASRLLSMPYSQPVQDMLDRLGFALTNRNIYKWQSKPASDTNGVPIPPNDFSATEAADFLRTNTLWQIIGAQTNLAKVKDSNFILSLTSNETQVTKLTVDFGDVQMLRALLYAAEYSVYEIACQNLDAQLNALYALYEQDAFDITHLLRTFPTALEFRQTNDLAAARSAFKNSAEQYFIASEIIRKRPTNIVRLFNFDPDAAADELRFRQNLTELVASLTNTVAFSMPTNSPQNLRVHLAKAFDGQTPFRWMLPEFVDQGVLLGTLPDPTFGGVVLGIDASDVYAGVTQGMGISAIPVFEVPTLGWIQFHALNGRNYSVQESTDLRHWTQIGMARGTDGQVRVPVSPLPPGRSKFLRAEDLSSYPSFSGTVLDAETSKPIAGAIVKSSLDGAVATTDAVGGFFLQTWQPRRSVGSFQLTASAAGYGEQSLWGYQGEGNEATGLEIRLYRAPSITTQPPDQTVVEGSAVVFEVAAVASPSPSFRWRKNGTNISGATSAQFRITAAKLTDAGGYSAVVSGAGGSITSRVAALTVTPKSVAPTIIRQPVSASVLIGRAVSFTVEATGTPDLKYQWYKNNLPIAVGISSTYTLSAVKASDAGTYKVVVSNAQGSVTSTSVTLTVR